MKFGASRSQMYDAQKTARARWEAAAESWDDEVRRRHAEAVVEPLDQLVTHALRAVDQLAVLFTEIRQACEYQD
jgi:hypothetical protein